MYRTLFAGLLALVVASNAQASAQDETPPGDRDVVVSIGDAYIPSGFDSSSDAFVVVNGLFPNGCYRWKGSKVTHDPANPRHEVQSIATVRGGMCIAVLVPFTEEVHLGKLDSGKHTIRFMNGDGTYLEKTLTID